MELFFEPPVDELLAPYWEAFERDAISLPRCSSCGAFQWYPDAAGPDCGDAEYEWVDVATTGTAGAEPAASRHELPYLLAGILRELEGGPLLWIPRLDRGSPDSGILTSRERVALVRVAGDLERRVVYGSPISSEVVEIEAVRLEEVL